VKALLRRYGPALGVGAAFVLLFALLMPSLLGRDLTRDHSAFRKNRWGCAALAELCRRVEPRLRVELLTRPLDDLSRVHGPLLIIDPEKPFHEAEVSEVVRWVEDGGTLVVAVEGVWADPAATPIGRSPAFVALIQALGVQFHELAKPADRAAPSPGSRCAAGVTQVAIETNEGVAVVPDPPNTEGTSELSGGGQPVLISFRRGQGEVFVSSDAAMFSNGVLAQEDNLRFVANLLWLHATEGAVYFDEYHHGFGARVRVGSAPDPAPLNRALMVAALGVAVFLFGKAQRFGAPADVFDPRRRVAMEYVEALAGLLARGEANQWALAKIGAAFRARLAAAVGLPTQVQGEALATALAERRGIPVEETSRLVAELDAALGEEGLRGRRLAELTGRMSAFEERAAAPTGGPRRGKGGR